MVCSSSRVVTVGCLVAYGATTQTGVVLALEDEVTVPATGGEKSNWSLDSQTSESTAGLVEELKAACVANDVNDADNVTDVIDVNSADVVGDAGVVNESVTDNTVAGTDNNDIAVIMIQDLAADNEAKMALLQEKIEVTQQAQHDTELARGLKESADRDALVDQVAELEQYITVEATQITIFVKEIQDPGLKKAIRKEWMKKKALKIADIILSIWCFCDAVVMGSQLLSALFFLITFNLPGFFAAVGALSNTYIVSQITSVIARALIDDARDGRYTKKVEAFIEKQQSEIREQIEEAQEKAGQFLQKYPKVIQNSKAFIDRVDESALFKKHSNFVPQFISKNLLSFKNKLNELDGSDASVETVEEEKKIE
jgi:hypothetical protein